MAFIEASEGHGLAVRQLQNHARGLATYMRPYHYVLLEPGQMPLNRAAKADYVVLRERARCEMQALQQQGRAANAAAEE